MTVVQQIYAIGDIHGDLKQLVNIHDRIQRDQSDEGEATIVHVGDLVDRRKDSRGVIDHIMQGQADGKPWIALKGNHDRLFQWFLEDPHRADPNLRSDYNWLHPRMGGTETLQSYGVELTEGMSLEEVQAVALKRVPQGHYDYLSAMPLKFETDELLFVHAGVRPNVAFVAQEEDDLVWIRKGFHEFTEPYAKLVVHGHTPVDEVTHYGNRVNIDTGAAWGKTLSAVVFEGTDVWVLEEDGRRLLLPTQQQ